MDYKTYALTSVHHFDSSVNRRAPDMAIQHRLGILSQRRFGFNFGNRVACCLTSLGQPTADTAVCRSQEALFEIS
jgi:hypothetical protein